MNIKVQCYWDGFYSSLHDSKLNFPSQFASFVASEFGGEKIDLLIDVGCGNGRDAIFFSKYGFPVLGIDESKQAIANCRAHSTDLSASYLCLSLEELELDERFIEQLKGKTNILVYARFVMHAISFTAEANFLKSISKISANNIHLAVEFRTVKDAQLSKVTSEHFRRYINSLDFIDHCRKFGFLPEYFAEGFGFAKFKKDDAHVARILLAKKVS